MSLKENSIVINIRVLYGNVEGFRRRVGDVIPFSRIGDGIRIIQINKTEYDLFFKTSDIIAMNIEDFSSICSNIIQGLRKTESGIVDDSSAYIGIAVVNVNNPLNRKFPANLMKKVDQMKKAINDSVPGTKYIDIK